MIPNTTLKGPSPSGWKRRLLPIMHRHLPLSHRESRRNHSPSASPGWFCSPTVGTRWNRKCSGPNTEAMRCVFIVRLWDVSELSFFLSFAAGVMGRDAAAVFLSLLRVLLEERIIRIERRRTRKMRWSVLLDFFFSLRTSLMRFPFDRLHPPMTSAFGHGRDQHPKGLPKREMWRENDDVRGERTVDIFYRFALETHL